MKTRNVIIVCLTWLCTSIGHDLVKIWDLQAQCEIARALRPLPARPSLEIVPDLPHTKDTTFHKVFFEDTQTREGGGSNAPSGAPSGEGAKRDNPASDDDRFPSVTIDRQLADAGTSAATPEPATPAANAPSAAPAILDGDEEGGLW